jgi:hypothetical protein
MVPEEIVGIVGALLMVPLEAGFGTSLEVRESRDSEELRIKEAIESSERF